MRIATLDGMQPAALQELDEIMEKQFAGDGAGGKTSVLGGAKVAANILNLHGAARREHVVMEDIQQDRRSARAAASRT